MTKLHLFPARTTSRSIRCWTKWLLSNKRGINFNKAFVGLKNEDDLKIEDDLKNGDNLKNEDYLKNEDNLKN